MRFLEITLAPRREHDFHEKSTKIGVRSPPGPKVAFGSLLWPKKVEKHYCSLLKVHPRDPPKHFWAGPGENLSSPREAKIDKKT